MDLGQLDHFLSFITSPHLVQDLPFGQKHLKLSSGDLIEVPNVIRLMIPQRVVQQYKQYCMETNFKPFSESTMRRVLSECSASVRVLARLMTYLLLSAKFLAMVQARSGRQGLPKLSRLTSCI